MDTVFPPVLEGRWQPIDEFPTYAICDDGRVASRSTGQPRSTSVNQGGHRVITLMRDGGRITVPVSGLVARAFVEREPFPEHFDTPVHLNGDKGDCHYENLVWRPRWFAVKYHKQFTEAYAHMRNLMAPYLFINQTEEFFENSFDAAVKYGMLNTEIVEALANERPSFPHNFTFAFVKPEDLPHDLDMR